MRGVNWEFEECYSVGSHFGFGKIPSHKISFKNFFSSIIFGRIMMSNWITVLKDFGVR